MDIPLEIAYRDVERTDSLDDLVRAKVDKLERHFDHIIGVRVAIERAVHRQNASDAFRVRVEVSVPNADVVVTREPHSGDYHEDLHAAVRDAFEKATRRLDAYKGKLRGDVKHREEPPHARIIRVFPYEGYGFIATPDGRELYFHENAVIGSDIHHLQIGMEVRFAESSDESGPHASTVTPVGKQNHHGATPPPPT